MKKLFLLCVIIFSLGVFFNLSLQETINYNTKIRNFESEIGMKFDLLIDFDAKEIYPLLEQTAKELNLNLFRPIAHYKYNPEKRIESSEDFKYILLVNDNSKYFDYVKVISGEKFNSQNINNSNLFMSTKKEKSKNQIALLKKFFNSNDITIAPLADSYSYLTINGKYFIETKDNSQYNKFLDVFANKLNDKFGKYGYHFESSNFIPVNSNNKEYYFTDYSIIYAGITLLFITLVIMYYYIFNNAKKISVMKLHGYSNKNILLKMLFVPVSWVFIFSNIIIIIINLFFANLHFCFLNIIYQLIGYIILIIFSSSTYLYIMNIKLSTAIKNKKHTSSICIINLFIKAICCAQVIIIILQIFSIYDEINNKKSIISNWPYKNDYGVLYRVLGNFSNEDYDDTRGEFFVNSDKLYLYLNNLGALFIDAYVYEQEVVEYNAFNVKYLTISANVNYLNRFPVYDINGNKINISENDTDYILLVPEKYKPQENDLKNFFTKDKEECGYIDGSINITERAGIYVSDEIKNQKLKIIWVKNNQWIFSMNSEVFPSEKNMIKEPIIQVITAKNSHLVIRQIDTGWGENFPLKVKLINQDSKLTYQTILPELKRLHLEDNYVHLSSLNEKITDKISDYQDQISYYTKRLILYTIILLILTIQSTIIIFDKNKLKLIIRYLHGFGFVKTHIEYVIMFIFNIVFNIIIYYLWLPLINFIISIFHYAPYYTNINAIYLIIALSICEFLASILVLKLIESKNKIKILKGGL